MIRRVLALMAFSGGIGIVACSSDAPADKYPSVDSFCTAKAEEECVTSKSADRCGVTADVCKGKRVAACQADASAAAGRSYTPSLADACLAATHAVYADPVVDSGKFQTYEDACNKVFAGKAAKGAPCTGAYDCSGALVCDTLQHLCADKVQKSANDFCGNPGEVCPTDQYCKPNGSAHQCAPKLTSTQACDKDNPCVDALYCNVTCVPKQQTTQPCASNDACSTGLCDTTATPSKCIARLYAS
jgi:hypothetical protein